MSNNTKIYRYKKMNQIKNMNKKKKKMLRIRNRLIY